MNKLLNFLDDSYKLKMIDGENVVYKQLNDSYDVEISIDSKKHYILYVYDISNGLGLDAIKHEFFETSSLLDLQDKLDQLHHTLRM